MNGQEGDYDVSEYIPNPSFIGRAEDDEGDDNIGAMSGDDNIGAMSGDDQDGGRIKKNPRHTPQQIQELENFFKECPLPTEEQKSELGRMLNLETRQIKFWFQNRRTQAKTHQEHHENETLRQEHDLLREEQEHLKQDLMLCSCNICGGPTNSGSINCLVQQLTDENARLKQKRDKAKSSIVNERSTFLVGPPVAQLSSSLMVPNQERNAPPELDSGGETLMMNKRLPFLVGPPVVQPSSSLMISNQERNVPPELDSDGETLMMNERSPYLAGSPLVQPSSSLMISNQGRNVQPEFDSDGEILMMNERSPYLVGPPAVQPSSSLMVSNQGRNVLPQLDSDGEILMMNERSPYLVGPPVVQPSSSLMISSQGRNVLPQLDSGGETSMMNERSTFLVGPPVVQTSSSLMISNQGRNVLLELDSDGETLMMNERSPYLVGPPAVQPSSSLMASDQGRNVPPQLDSGGETWMMNERSPYLVGSPAVQLSSSLMISNQGRNVPLELDSDGETLMMTERSPYLVGPPIVQPSSSLMISNQRRNILPEFDLGGETSMMNKRSTFLVGPPAVQSSSSLMISNQGRNAPQELDSGCETSMMKERSPYLVGPPAVQPSSSLLVSNPGRNAPPELDSGGDTSMMYERSTFLVGPPVAQPSSSLMISNPGRNAPSELYLGGETSMMNEKSTFLIDPPVAQPSSLMISNRERNAQPKLDSGDKMSTVNKKSMLEFAIVAMNELIKLGETSSPLWRIDSSSKRETLNYEEYRSFLNNGLIKRPEYVMEASRDTGLVLMDSLALVKILTTNKWVNVFAPMVSVATTHRLIPIGYGGPRSGSLKLIEAQFQVIFPLVPKRQVKFLRYCKKLREGLWAVVDVTPRRENLNLLSDGGSNRLPSGVIIEDLTNGSSKVTWIEQAEYDESQIPQLYQLSVGSGIGLGAKRWLTTLQRYCENLSILSSINLAEVYQGLSTNVATEIVKLAQRMTLDYYSGITGSSARKWKRSHVEKEGQENMRLLTRKNVNVRGEHTGIVLNAATSVWFPVSQQTMFDFLSNLSLRDQWDILTSDTSIEEKIKIQKSRCRGNCVSIIRFVENGEKDASVLQETWNDASGALLVYAPLETDSVQSVMAGGDSNSVQILPSGFSILPDGREKEPDKNGGGCLLTLGYQFLVTSEPTAEVDQGFVKTVEELIALTIDSIKSALSIQT